ncbi:MAG: glutamate racemase [Erysipelotrichaceae bacterium]
MSSLRLGVMDSGMGGLTVVDLLHKRHPEIKIIFLGDTANMPYGDKSKKQIISFAENNIAFLSRFSLDGILIACNTMDSNAYQLIKNQYPIKLYPIIEPTCRQALQVSKNKKIALLATAATVNSNTYQKCFDQLDPQVRLQQISAPGLAELVETQTDASHLLNKYLSPLKDSDCDTLILGCTHYPLLERPIREILPNITLVSSSSELVNSLQLPKSLDSTVADVEYYVTKNPAQFSEIAKGVFNYPINAQAVKVVD